MAVDVGREQVKERGDGTEAEELAAHLWVIEMSCKVGQGVMEVVGGRL